MSRVYTVATMTATGKAMGGVWDEPEIGRGVYGNMRDVPPLFTSSTRARLWAKEKGIKKFLVVPMEILR